jgi:hypothetical protein
MYVCPWKFNLMASYLFILDLYLFIFFFTNCWDNLNFKSPVFLTQSNLGWLPLHLYMWNKVMVYIMHFSFHFLFYIFIKRKGFFLFRFLRNDIGMHLSFCVSLLGWNKPKCLLNVWDSTQFIPISRSNRIHFQNQNQKLSLQTAIDSKGFCPLKKSFIFLCSYFFSISQWDHFCQKLNFYSKNGNEDHFIFFTKKKSLLKAGSKKPHTQERYLLTV